MFIFLHSIRTNIRTIRREVFEYSNNIRIFKVARIRIRIVIFVKNYSNIRIIRIFVTTLLRTAYSQQSKCKAAKMPAQSVKLYNLYERYFSYLSRENYNLCTIPRSSLLYFNKSPAALLDST